MSPVEEKNIEVEETEDVEPIEEEQQELESSEEDSEQEESDEGSEDEKPFWLSDDDEEGEQDSSEKVPEAALINIKRKLKGRIQERDSEIEQLKVELEQLKAGQSQAQTDLKPPKRPRVSDFNTDDEYEEAMDKYEEEKLTYQQQAIKSSSNRKEELERTQKEIETSVESHYDRAAKLIKENGVSPDLYKQADEATKQVIESVIPKAGEIVFNGFVNMIGEGSEKTMFYVGRNKSAQAEFANLLNQDKTGLKAAVYLGRLTEKISGAKNKTSRAPKPAPGVQGEGGNSQSGALLRKYKEAHKKGNIQKAYDLKKQAKAQGIDVKKWG